MKNQLRCIFFISEVLTQSVSGIDDYEKLHNYITEKMNDEDPSLRAGIGNSLEVNVQLFVEDITNLNQVSKGSEKVENKLEIFRRTTNLICKELFFWVGKMTDLNSHPKQTYLIPFGNKICMIISTPLRNKTLTEFGHRIFS